MHNCDLHLNQIKDFITKTNLKLVHVHANNNGPIRLSDGLPLTLELTFSRYAKYATLNELPHSLDLPNDKNKPEIFLSIES